MIASTSSTWSGFSKNRNHCRIYYIETSTTSDFPDIQIEEIQWSKVFDSREELKRFWFESLYRKLKIFHVNPVPSVFRNRRILRCNRKGIGLKRDLV